MEITEKRLSRSERMSRINSFYRMLDAKWNSYKENKILFVLCLFNVLNLLIGVLCCIFGKTIENSTFWLSCFTMFSLGMSGKPGASDGERTLSERLSGKYTAELSKHLYSLIVLPVKPADYFELSFKKWWKLCSVFLLLNNACFAFMILYHRQALDIFYLYCLLILCLMPVSFLVMEFAEMPLKKGVKCFMNGFYAIYTLGILLCALLMLFDNVWENRKPVILFDFEGNVILAVLSLLVTAGFCIFLYYFAISYFRNKKNLSYGIDGKKKNSEGGQV